ncbi:nucleotidyltransferase [Caulobacter flavus]|uniref:Nucleotidyltransferase n=1 Tax=Caulobacter flavus TaxID=1679497 RepID=A0A2N5CZG3_9CAUL|nr:HEPN domain-containing protein [Caulobacter flavus]AYV45106.1 nucleotidyltransferase [Caulobacter flavus]PLR19214.1 nucleotidyltransferase [Caulobacter flavus]
MKQSLDHLPDGKRRELAFVVETLQATFARAIAHRTQQRYRNGRLLKIVLFDSYARGDWIEDPAGRYFSSYDLLVVVNHPDLTDLDEFWSKADCAFLDELSNGNRLRTQTNFIVHDLDDVNEQLRSGRLFFTEMLREGVILFEEPDFPFAAPTAIPAAAACSEAKRYVDDWLPSSRALSKLASTAQELSRPREAAFLLHQAAEKAYHGLILILTRYSARTHRLTLLRDRAEALDERLRGLWPRERKFDRKCFNLLQRAYIEARYSPDYSISDEQLAWLTERVGVLQAAVSTIATERIEALGVGTRNSERLDARFMTPFDAH